MKKFTITILTILALTACDNAYVAPILENKPLKDNQNFLKNTNALLNSFEKEETISGSENYGNSVIIYNELLTLFSPDNFKCGLNDKIKNRLKNSKREDKDVNGFVPDYVANSVNKFESGIKLKGRGANVLLHYFTYQKKNKKESIPITSKDAPSQLNFNAIDYIDSKNSNYDSFYFTMDCAGFFSASAEVSAKGGFLGFGKGSIAAEGKKTINQSQSIILMRVLIHSPLYSAFVDTSIFRIDPQMEQNVKNNIYNSQILTLQAILKAIPSHERIDNNRVFLNENYEAIITSNKGSAGYNGEGELNSNIQINFTSVQISGGVQATNSISRNTKFTSYNTYIISDNIDAELEEINIKDIRDKISALKQLIVQTP